MHFSPDGDKSNLHQKVGGNISLPCNNVVYKNCSSTVWNFNKDTYSVTIELVGHGVKKEHRDRAERLSVGSDCSLMVLNVKTEDAGRYTCRQYPPEGGDQTGTDAVVYLSVQTSRYICINYVGLQRKQHDET